MARLVNYGAGEVCDRLSILALKILYGTSAQLEVSHWERERSVLLTKIAARQLGGAWFACYVELAAVNATIWKDEDELRYQRESPPEVRRVEYVAEIAFRLQDLNDRRNVLIELINKEVGDHLGSEKLEHLKES